MNRDMMIGWEPRDEECKALKSVRDQKGRSQMRASRFGETVDQSPLPYSLENNKICWKNYLHPVSSTSPSKLSVQENSKQEDKFISNLFPGKCTDYPTWFISLFLVVIVGSIYRQVLL